MATNPEGQPSKSAEWEQTLVAEETVEQTTPMEAAPAAETTLEAPPPPPPVLETMEAPVELPPQQALQETPPALEEPSVADETVDEFPAELRRYIRREGSTLILKEPFLPLATRAEVESKVAGRGTKLVERRWIPAKREPIHEIEKAVDALDVRPHYQPKGVSWLNRSTIETRRALRGLERVPANIVAKRVVYETEGGLVVEVTYRELGQVLKKYFTVPAIGTRAKILRDLRSGSYAQATAVSDDLIDAVTRPRARGHSTTPAGMVNTWPIRNKHRLEVLGVPRRSIRELDRLGIHSTDQLRVRSPVVISRHLAIPGDEAQAWAYACEFLLLPKMGPAHAKVLTEGGIKGLEHLRRLSPLRVVELVQPFLTTKKGNVPGIGRARAAAWVRAAKKLRKTKQPFPA